MQLYNTVDDIKNEMEILYRNITGKPSFTAGEADIIYSSIIDAYQVVLQEYGVANFRFQEEDVTAVTTSGTNYVDLDEYVYKVVNGSVRIPERDITLTLIDEVSIFQTDPRDEEVGEPASYAFKNSGDPNVMRLRLYPTPNAALTIYLKVLKLPTDTITNFPTQLMAAIKNKAKALSCLGLGLTQFINNFEAIYEKSIDQIKDGYDYDGPKHIGRISSASIGPSGLRYPSGGAGSGITDADLTSYMRTFTLSDYGKTLVDDADADAALTTLSSYTGTLGLGTLTTKVVIVNVKAFGAVGDGTTDDTTAIQNAINSLGQDITQTPTGGGIVFFPEGTYKITAQLNTYSGVYIIGVGQGATIIDASAITNTNHWTFRTHKNANWFGFKDFDINGGQGTVPAGGILIGNDSGDSGNFIAHFYVKDIQIKNFWKAGGVGLKLQNPSHGTIDNVTTTGMNGTGGVGCIVKANNAVTGVISFDNCKFGTPYTGTGNPNKIGLQIQADTNTVNVGELTFNSCFFGGDTIGVELDLVASAARTSRNITFRGCILESDFATACMQISSGHCISVENCGFHGHGIAPQGILIDKTGDAKNIRIQNNSFVNILTDCVKLASSEAGTFENITVGGFYVQTTSPTKLNDAGGSATLIYDDAIETLTADDATPSVFGKRNFKTGDDDALNITDFDDGHPGQIINIIGADGGLTTIVHDATKINLAGGANITLGDQDVLALIYDGTDWSEISRSVNS